MSRTELDAAKATRKLEITESGRRYVQSAEFVSAMGLMLDRLRDPGVNSENEFEAAQAYTAIMLCSDEAKNVKVEMDEAGIVAVADFIDAHEAEISELIIHAAFQSACAMPFRNEKIQ